MNESGSAHMVSVADKLSTKRIAVARGHLSTTPDVIKLVQENTLKKGDALATARIAGIMAAKRTAELIPLCHNIVLSRVAVDLTMEKTGRIDIESTVECTGSTGVEMEAMTACSVAALTLYDMLKAVDKHMVISDIRVVAKLGGKADWKLSKS